MDSDMQHGFVIVTPASPNVGHLRTNLKLAAATPSLSPASFALYERRHHWQGGFCVSVATVLSAIVLRSRFHCTSRRGRRRVRSHFVARCVDQRGSPVASPFDPATSETTVEYLPDAISNVLPLTLENVEAVLNDVRPYLRADGGDCELVEAKDGIVRLRLLGACSSCSASSVTVKMGIERSLLERIPDIKEVVVIGVSLEQPSRDGLQALLDEIRPFLVTSKGRIDIEELSVNNAHPRLVLRFSGPPRKSVAIRASVINRITSRYPVLHNFVEISIDDA